MLTTEQQANRKKGVGASEAATVMGLSQYMSPYQLWLIKTGRAEPQDLSDVAQVYWGTVHEDNIAQEYAKRNNCQVECVPETLFHVKHKFMLCHLDRRVVGLRKILECKFAMFAKDDWGPSGSDQVPLAYIVQVQYQLAITGYEEADLAVLIGGYDWREYHFKRDEALIAKIIEEVSAFWACVESDTAPELRDRTDAALAWPNTNGNLKEADVSMFNNVIQFRELRAKVKELEEQKDELADKLTLFIQDCDGIKFGDEMLASWKPTARGNRVLRVMETK